MAPQTSKPRHNFSMPCLKWGKQRLLRCMKVKSNGEFSSFYRRSSASEAETEGLIKDFDLEKRRSSSSFESSRKLSARSPNGNSGSKSNIRRNRDDGIDAVWEKLIFHLRTSTDKMNFSIPKEEEEDESSLVAAKPWNLRTRRSPCIKISNEIGGGISRNEERQQKPSPQRTENPLTKSIPARGLAAAQYVEKERQKFAISLSRDEIEEDFAAMMRTRPYRRPKKRAKIIQKQLDTLFPGLWLSEITVDSYKVPDEPESRKE